MDLPTKTLVISLPEVISGGVLEPTGYDEYSIDLKAKYKLKSNANFTAAYQRVKQMDVPLYHKIASGEYQIYHINPQQRELAYLKLASYYKSKFASEIHYTLSYQNSLEIREKQKTGSVEFVEEVDEVNTLGTNIEVVSDLTKAWKASSGIEYYHDLIGSKAEIKNVETGEVITTRGLYPDGSQL